MQIKPSPSLSHIIKHFLILEGDGGGIANHRMFPDGNPGLVFHYETPFQNQPRSFLYGQLTHFHDITPANKIGVLIVVFQPYGAYSLLGIPAHELTDLIIPLQDIWGTSNVEDTILNAHNNAIRINLIEALVLKQQQPSQDNLIKQTIREIYSSHGLSTVAELCKLTHTTERNLERKFREQIGISPKNFSSTIRLQYFLKLLRTQSNKTLTTLAYESGYYDQAHLIREFKKQSGITPKNYLSKAYPLAVNFIRFS
jgi:AraC-like DNA-binding protein